MPKFNESKTMRHSKGGKSIFKVIATFSHYGKNLSNWTRYEAEDYLEYLKNTSDYFDSAEVVEVVEGGFAGRTIIQRIEQQMDKRRRAMEKILVENGPIEYDGVKFLPKEHTLNQGRYEGLAAALAILRSSSVEIEVNRSNERLGID